MEGGALALDADENAGSALIVVPIAAMTVVMDEGVMVMLAVEPTLVVVVVSQDATGADDDEENGQEGWQEIFVCVFHFTSKPRFAHRRHGV